MSIHDYISIITALPNGQEFTAYQLFGHNYHASLSLMRLCCVSNMPFERIGFTKNGANLYRRK